MDLQARRHPVAPAQSTHSDQPPETPVPKPKPAAALHRRGRVGGRILDLRQAAPKPGTPAIQPVDSGVPAAAPHSTSRERNLARLAERLERAKATSRSHHISKFGQAQNPPPTAPKTKPAAASAPPTGPDLPSHAATQHAAMAQLAKAEAPDKNEAPSWQPHQTLTPPVNRALTVAAAVAIMGGYIWFQNYPKLALQSASNKAGVTATLPGYLPSSYTLTNTNTAPGMVTLSFTSPSASETLRIAQHHTTWDSSSLLDNFVAKATDDYATVQGQGLTIYLFNNNHAAWVNHGVWYSIEGAARLSREQILKIAYSL